MSINKEILTNRKMQLKDGFTIEQLKQLDVIKIAAKLLDYEIQETHYQLQLKDLKGGKLFKFSINFAFDRKNLIVTLQTMVNEEPDVLDLRTNEEKDNAIQHILINL